MSTLIDLAFTVGLPFLAFMVFVGFVALRAKAKGQTPEESAESAHRARNMHLKGF